VKKYHKLDCAYDYNFVVLAINSHSKGYKLCWSLNKAFGLNFEVGDNHKVNKELTFTRYKSKNIDGEDLNLIINRSKKGYMIPSKKSVNYFLIIKKNKYLIEKDEFLSKLREINDILLVFEVDINKEKNSERFIINDKKN